MKQFTDENGNRIEGSIAEKEYIEIGGKKIWFIIKGKNLNNPVLLYLHGGMPDYFFTGKYPTHLDDIFTVVWLDQRGSGLSYNARYKDKEITINDLIEDVKIISEYLIDRFTQEKLYLMAHSGGTYLGIKVISKYPELFNAYIGVAQISYQKMSEKIAYEYILDKFKYIKNRKKVYKKLKNSPVEMDVPIPINYIKLRDYTMHILGIGTMRNIKNVITGIFIPSLLFREYSIKDKIHLWKGKKQSGLSIMWNEIENHDLSDENVDFKIPIYLFHGIYDYTCSYKLALEYYNRINAPIKDFVTFINSAHSPIFEEPEKCVKYIKEKILFLK